MGRWEVLPDVRAHTIQTYIENTPSDKSLTFSLTHNSFTFYKPSELWDGPRKALLSD